MDAFLLSILLCLLLESAGKLTVLFDALRARYGNALSVTAGLAIALATNAAISAAAGAYIATMLTPEARRLFLSLALAGAAVALIMRTGRVDILQGWRLGPFLTSTLGLFILAFGESAQFIIVGLAAAYADPWMAGTGGWLGSIGACLLMPVLRAATPDLHRGGKWLRRCGAVLLLSSAFVMAMSALRLIA